MRSVMSSTGLAAMVGGSQLRAFSGEMGDENLLLQNKQRTCLYPPE